MQPKRLLSITQDDELHRHLDHLSEDEHEEVNRVLGPALYNSERAISQNLALAVEQGKLPVKDMVNLPPHYARFPIEPIRFAVENGLNFLQGNEIGERRVGKECLRLCRSRWSPYH